MPDITELDLKAALAAQDLATVRIMLSRHDWAALAMVDDFGPHSLLMASETRDFLARIRKLEVAFTAQAGMPSMEITAEELAQFLNTKEAGS